MIYIYTTCHNQQLIHNYVECWAHFNSTFSGISNSGFILCSVLSSCGTLLYVITFRSDEQSTNMNAVETMCCWWHEKTEGWSYEINLKSMIYGNSDNILCFTFLWIWIILTHWYFTLSDFLWRWKVNYKISSAEDLTSPDWPMAF